ncbi:MBL fold metallo-hydrolase [Flavobacterium sp.]|uniref:MBL fold metallo-hydrolase n=1 Tax=Flavobacterium sp. TaxID=239 RepID=UPI0039E3EF2A
MEVQFLGGAGTVTGSKTLIQSNGATMLIDCGQFQGVKALRELNWKTLPVGPSTIDYVLLTHGHLDHCGWLPCLVEQGFAGKILCTSPTKAIARLILLDSAKIQEEEAAKANAGHYSKHQMAKPLYTVAQAKQVFSLFHTVHFNEPVMINPEIKVMFTNAGHILGAASIELKLENKTLVFSGDIGRDNDVLMFPPFRPKKANYLFLESTYGNRVHPDTDVKLELETYINNTLKNGGTVIIPGFAVERIQSIMYLLWQLRKEQRIPDVPYIIDTPMGISVFEIFKANPQAHKLSLSDCAAMEQTFTMIADFEQTVETIYDHQPKVVIAASGMVTGGRVLSYLEHYIERPETTVIIVGYQAEGTRGRKLLEGAAEIKIHGRFFSVKANILEIQGLSAHADQNGLLHWLSELQDPPKKIFLVHGENEPADELRIKIREKYNYACQVPLHNEIVNL